MDNENGLGIKFAVVSGLPKREERVTPRDPPPDCTFHEAVAMTLLHYEHRVALYECSVCKKRVAIGEGSK